MDKKKENIFAKARKNKGLTQEAASAQLNMTSDKLSRIEGGKQRIEPADVMNMQKLYSRSDLANYYCSHECPIGIEEVSPIEANQLSVIILKMVNAFNYIDQSKNRLMEIADDDKISEDELEDFARIQYQLNHISSLVKSLKVWVDQQVINGGIDYTTYKETYDKIAKKLNK
jgi:transcriptional regulator with XRE-family HTH domain